MIPTVVGYTTIVILGLFGCFIVPQIMAEKLFPKRGLDPAFKAFWVGVFCAGLWLGSWAWYFFHAYVIVITAR